MMESFLNELQQRAASFTDEEFARLKRIIMERRGRAAAPAIVAPIGISFDARVCMEESTEGKMGPERGALESTSSGTGLEAPGQQCLSN